MTEVGNVLLPYVRTCFCSKPQGHFIIDHKTHKFQGFPEILGTRGAVLVVRKRLSEKRESMSLDGHQPTPRYMTYSVCTTVGMQKT